MIPADSGWELNIAQAINDRAQANMPPGTIGCGPRPVTLQRSTVLRGCMLLLALLPSVTALAEKPASHAQRPRHNEAVNRDGILDLVFENGGSPYLFIFAGQGDGTFSALPSPTLPAFPDILPGAAYADVNRDGNLDLVSTVSGVPGEGQTTVYTAFGKGNGLFHDCHTSAVANEIYIGGAAFGDFNGDGKLDLVEEAGLFDLKYDFFLGNGHSTFNLNSSVDLNTDSGPVTPVVADFNGDGKLDLATVTGDNHGGAVAILLQQ